jgi:hypothetical protein
VYLGICKLHVDAGVSNELNFSYKPLGGEIIYMLQITVDLSLLSKAQRESLSGFILDFPYSDEAAAEIPAFTTGDEPEDLEAAAVFAAHPIPEAVNVDEEPVSDLEAAAIFGVANPPVPVAIVPAPAAGPVLVPNPPAVAAVAVENDRLDKSGLPWDERIHASSRAKNADSTWRKKRGIDEGTVALVEAELKALMMLPAAPAPAVPAPPAAIPAPPVSAAVVEDRQSYVTLLSVASAAINAKTLTNEQLSAAVVAVGVPSLPLLANRLDLVPQVMAAVKAIIG